MPGAISSLIARWSLCCSALKLHTSQLLLPPNFAIPIPLSTINNRPIDHPVTSFCSIQQPYPICKSSCQHSPDALPPHHSLAVHSHVPCKQALPATYFTIPEACFPILHHRILQTKARALTIHPKTSLNFRNNKSSAGMLFSTLAVAVGAFASAVSAQANFTSCCSVTPSSVDMTVRLSWCRAQQNTCPETCQNGQVSANSCDAVRFSTRHERLPNND